MRFIEIRLQEGLLLLGSPGMFPGVLRKSSDDKLLASALRKLTANPSAMGHLRRNWLELGQRLPVVGLDDHELLVLMRREVSRGRLCAAMLGSRSRSVEMPDVEEPAAAPVIHLHHDGKTILIAGKGQLPHEFSGHRNNAQAAEIIRKVPHGGPAALAIEKQASRLPGASVQSISGPQLRELIAWQLEKGGHDAVVLDHPHLVQKASLLPSAPRPVSQWSLTEKIREALRLSISHLPAELVNAAAIALIMEIGIALGVLIAAQFVPGGNAAVDAFVAAVVYRIAGVAGLIAFWQIAHATYIAANANSEAELDEAGQEYAAGFVAIGLAKLAEIRAKLLEGKMGGGAKEAGGAGASKSRSSSAPKQRQSSSEPEPQPKPEPRAKAPATVEDESAKVAAKLIKSAKEAEPSLTKDIVSATKNAEGDLAGLEYRLKTEESLARKIATDMEKGGLTAEEAASRIVDTNRYTSIFPTEKLVDGYGKVIADLEAKGYKVTKVKNTWDDPTVPYNGVNVQMVSPEGQPVELQFHTPESFAAKDTGTHALYEEQRKLPKDSPRWQELEQQQRDIFNQSPRPPGVEKILPFPR